MVKRTIRMEMNRVEGDLEVQIEIEGHTVTDAWCVGTMYRGFEQILLGRDPNDVLVITPRICGICSTSQLYATTSALEMAYQTPVAPNGIRIRNLCLMAESVMSDARQTVLMFAPDFCNRAYSHHDLYGQVMRLCEPLDIMEGILKVARQLADGRAEVENQYNPVRGDYAILCKGWGG